MIFYHFFRAMILPLKEIDMQISDTASIVELGCGQGVISAFLAQKSGRNIVGVDKNVRRLKKSNLKNLKFIKGDITKLNFKNLDAIIISDVLHHLNPKSQKTLLSKIPKMIKKRGVLVIKEIDKAERIRMTLSRIWDFLLYPNDKIFYFDCKELKNQLEKLGFTVKLSRPCRFFPGSTTLLTCKKY